jgi:hypothetical protein
MERIANPSSFADRNAGRRVKCKKASQIFTAKLVCGIWLMPPIGNAFLYCLPTVSFCCGTQASAQQAPGPARADDDRLLKKVSDFLEHLIDPMKKPALQAALFARNAQYDEQSEQGRDCPRY